MAAAIALVLAPAAFGLAEERQIQVSAGESLRIVEVGHGQPVVLVPGLLGSAFSFRNLIPPLAARGHRVIVIEPLGVGGSGTPPAADYSLTAQADRLDTVLRMLDADEAVIVAHGVGASMALRLADRHAERVKAIVSIDGGPAEAAATPGFRRAMRLSWLIKVFGGIGRIRRAVRSTLIERSVDSTWVTEDVVEGYMAAAARDLDGTLRAFRQISKAGEPQLLAPHLVEVRCPVRLVIGDDRTRGISDAEIQLLSTQLGAFSIDRVEHTGHFLYEEEPLAVVTAVERALAETRPENRLAARRP
jgi:pimeloyl-ACP methyl ester carboxylesterase